MISMRRAGRALLLIFPIVFPFSSAVSGIRWDWTPAEKACARKIGVQLGGATKEYIRLLAWVSDVVVTGTVTRLEHDANVGFPTTVVLAVQRVHKGEHVPESIDIVLNSGPIYSEVYKRTIGVIGGPTFEVGERVLVFLTGRTYVSALRGMEEVSLLPHQFGVVDSKWTVHADGTASFGWACATSDETSCGPERNDRVDWLTKEIELARVAQANCRAEPER